MDLGTRQIRYFVAVAEELNFTRAARRLYIAQQALSAQVSQLEEKIGARLLTRTTRKVELTAAGELFLHEAKRVLASLDRAVEGAQQLHRNQYSTLRLGLHLGGALELTVAILAEFRRCQPDVRLEMVEGSFADPSMGLADYLVDVAIVRPPLSAEGLRYEHLFSEPRLFMVGRDHEFASLDKVPLAEALKQPITRAKCSDDVWNNYWMLAKYREGELPIVGAEVGSTYEELETVASGRACSITAAGLTRFMSHPGVVTLPFEEEVDPSICAVAWRTDADNEYVRDFVQAAMTVCEREVNLVHAIEHPSPSEPLGMRIVDEPHAAG